MGRKTSAAKPSKKKSSTSSRGSTDKEPSADTKGWTTQQQKQFLWDKFDTYMTHVPWKKYQPFWTMLEKEWKDRWPEITIEFPGRRENELTATELEKLANAEEKRLRQLQTWFRWRAPPMHERDLLKQHTKLDDAIDALTCRQRALRPYEMYSHMYRERFEEELQTQYQAHPKADPGERLKIWRTVAQDCYANEEEDIKRSVMDELDECAYRRRKGKEAKNTPDSYLQAIKDLNAVLARYFDVLAEKTGWCFEVLMGGPHPKNPGGAIEVMSHSAGASYKNKFFPDAMIGFEDTVMQPWINHLKLIFPQAVCAERALSSGSSTSELCAGALLTFDSNSVIDGQTSSSDVEAMPTDDGEDGTAASKQVVGVGDSDDGKEETMALDVHTPTSATTDDGGPMAVSATVISHTDLPISIDQSTASTSSVNLAVLPQTGDQITPNPNVAMSFTELLAASPLMVGLLLGSVNQPASVPNTSEISALPCNTGSTLLTLDSNAGDFSGLFNFQDCGSSGLGLENFDFTFPDILFNDINNGDLAAGNGEASGQWFQSSESGATSTQATLSYANLLLPASNILHVPGTSQAVSDLTQAPIVTPHLPATPLGTLAVNSTTPAAEDTSQSAIAPVIAPIVANQLTTSRGRHVKPSQSAEQMNRIGSAAGSILVGKENIPPSSTHDWLTPAREYLEKQDFGSDWVGCITAWLALEGSPKKKNGTMPLPKQRPEEWSKWATKTAHGRRGGYDSMPAIESTVEFGSAIMKWWHDIQPAFRQSADSAHPAVSVTPPTDFTNDIWAPLRKNGPNGLVIVLVLLSWWGHATKRRNVWEDDSTPAWKKTVTDVRNVFDALVGSVGDSGGGVKRTGDALPVQKKKRRTE